MPGIRTLQKLQGVFHGLLEKHTSKDAWAQAEANSLQELRTRVIRLPWLGRALRIPSAAAIRAALEGNSLGLTARIHDDTVAD